MLGDADVIPIPPNHIDFEMTDRRRRRPKVLLIAAMDFIRQLENMSVSYIFADQRTAKLHVLKFPQAGD